MQLLKVRRGEGGGERGEGRGGRGEGGGERGEAKGETLLKGHPETRTLGSIRVSHVGCLTRFEGWW